MNDNDTFAKLAKLDKHQIKSKTVKWTDKKTGEVKQYSARFVTARTVMNILDEVVGPANWRAEFSQFSAKVVQCTLYLRLNDEWVGKSDVGTVSDIEPEKGAVSDAFKRAAVHWGIARELYNEGTASLESAEPEYSPPAQHDRERETMSNEAGDALEDVTWTRDAETFRKMIDFARRTWSDPSAQPMTFPHVYNRLGNIFGLSGRAKTRDELQQLFIDEYTGSKAEALGLITAYEPATADS